MGFNFNQILGHADRETISTGNSIAIINHLPLHISNFFIKAMATYLNVLWSNLESSGMCRWNKILIPPFGARSTVYHPLFIIQLFHAYSIVKTITRGAVDDLIHYCMRPKPECNSASGRPRY